MMVPQTPAIHVNDGEVHVRFGYEQLAVVIGSDLILYTEKAETQTLIAATDSDGNHLAILARVPRQGLGAEVYASTLAAALAAAERTAVRLFPNHLIKEG